MHVRRDRAEAEADVEDRVADELAGPVVGDVATPVGVDELGADRLRIDEDVLGARPHAEGVHMRVLQQEQVLATAPARRAPAAGRGRPGSGRARASGREAHARRRSKLGFPVA